MTARRWLVRLGEVLEDRLIEVTAPDAQTAAEQAAELWDHRDLRLLRQRGSLAATVIVPDTGDAVAFTVRASAVPVYTAHLEVAR